MSPVQLSERSGSNQSSGGVPSLLQINDISVTFEKMRGVVRRHKQLIRAVDHVSFSINESEFLSLVGESGSGKTTVARCILGLEKPQTGSILYNGIEVQKLKGRALHNYWRDVQIIYQDPFESLNPREDVFSTISAPLRQLCGENEDGKIFDQVAKLLEEVELDPNLIMRRLPHQLSGGQRQRVNIARALAPNPKILIADEPITMLDAAQRLNVLSLLMRLKQNRKLTILMITHDLASAKMTSSRTIVMYLGKQVESGPTKEVLTRAYHPYVKLILDSMPDLRSEDPLAKTEAIPSLDEAPPPTIGCIFRPRCQFATEVCKNVEPPLSELSPAHLAACHNPVNAPRSLVERGTARP